MVEEPLSSLLSFLTSLLYLLVLLQLTRELARSWRSGSRDFRRFSLLFMASAFFWCATYFGSGLFHWHETRFNEAVDYLGGAWSLFFMAFATFVHLLSHLPLGRASRAALALAVGALLLLRWLYLADFMLHVRFSTSFFIWGNMAPASAFQTAVCATLALLRWSEARGGGPLAWVALAHAFAGVAVAFELNDFRPRLALSVDAHSMWHLASMLSGASWCRFLLLEQRRLLNPLNPHKTE